MRHRKQVLGLGLLLAAATSVPALAQPTTASQGYPTCSKTPRDSDLAHQRYIAGKQDYDEGNYDSAVRRFRDAYTLDCTKHELLIIISAAHERRGDKKEAVLALETYIARAPSASAPEVSTYQAKVDNLKKQIAAAPPAPAVTSPSSTGTAPALAGETREHTIYPWIMSGAGVLALGVGIAVLVTAPSLPAGCDASAKTCTRIPTETETNYQERQQQAGRSQTQPVGGALVIAGGGALIIGGVVWHLLEPTGPKESAKARVRPTVTPTYAGLSLGGAF